MGVGEFPEARSVRSQGLRVIRVGARCFIKVCSGDFQNNSQIAAPRAGHWWLVELILQHPGRFRNPRCS